VSVEDTVRGLWNALSDRDYEAAKTYLADDCIYFDVPVGPAAAARGPEDAMKRIRIAWDGLSHYENYDGIMVTNGVDVMYEHSEKWVWPTGETATLPSSLCTRWSTARSLSGRTTGT
jgi:ketosteroid isomerase-like protein